MATRGLIFDFDGTLAVLTIDFAAMAAEVRARAAELGFAGPWPGRGYLLEQAEEVARALGDGFLARAHAMRIEARELARPGPAGCLPSPPAFWPRPGRGATPWRWSPQLRGGHLPATVFPGRAGRRVDAFLPREAAPRPSPTPSYWGGRCKMLGLAPERRGHGGRPPQPTWPRRPGGGAAARVGVLSGRTGREEMQKAGADLILPDAGGLMDALAEG